MGELVQNSSGEVGHAIQFRDVRFLASCNTVAITLQHSKTDQEGKGVKVTLRPSNMSVCPVRSLKSFLRVRPGFSGSFFATLGDPLSQDTRLGLFFSMLFSKLGLDAKDYKHTRFVLVLLLKHEFKDKVKNKLRQGADGNLGACIDTYMYDDRVVFCCCCCCCFCDFGGISHLIPLFINESFMTKLFLLIYVIVDHKRI
jgi:hypothetical protein